MESNNPNTWSSLVTGSDKFKFFAVLHQDPVNSAQDAVKALIASGYGKVGEKSS